MIHARPDYMRIQDPGGLIPPEEPVFLLRAQDKTASLVVAVWAAMQPDGPLKELAQQHRVKMENWRPKKWADITLDQRNEVHGPPPVGVIRDYVAEIAEELKRQLVAAVVQCDADARRLEKAGADRAEMLGRIERLGPRSRRETGRRTRKPDPETGGGGDT